MRIDSSGWMGCVVAVVLLLVLASACSAQPASSMRDAADLAALRQAVSDLVESFPGEYPRGTEFAERISALQAVLDGGRRLSQAMRWRRDFEQLQREALLANPLLTRHELLFVVRKQYRPDHHNTETMFQVGEINEASFEGGGALKALDLNTGVVRTLVDAPEGIVRDPGVYFEGDRIVFSMRPEPKGYYHIYEINADGTGLKQLTSAPGITDIDPLYLPNGDIVFSSTREPKYCMCNRHIMANLFRMEGDGANIHQIGKSTLFEGHGALLPDGRIIYYRWEYIDRNFGDAQGLWTVNPDGTMHAVYWGNNTNSPGAVLDPRPVPGTPWLLCTFSSCHDRPWGALALIDRRLGLDGLPAVLRTWPEDAIHLVGQGDFDTFIQVNPKFEDPWPLSEKYFLCSRMTGEGERMGIYLLDVFGNEILVHVEGEGCFDPMPITARPRPPEIPSRRDFEQRYGTFYVADVYEGTHMEGVERGSARYLRVVESPEKRSFVDHQQWGGQGQQNPGMNWHDFNNKRILGAVPVEADGSAYFTVPAETWVYFQLLDDHGMMIQSMRSGVIVQPGEMAACTGCHEDRRSAPPAAHRSIPLALRRAPSELEGWRGPPRFFNYRDEVQPVFDRHCMSCHDFGGEGAEKVVLAGDRDLIFNASYAELWRKQKIAAIGAGPAEIQQAYSWGSHASRMIQVLREGHHDIELDPESFDRLVTWIDINAPYYPRYETAFPDNYAGRAPLTPEEVKRLTQLTGVPFHQYAAFHSHAGPQISFERPEQSPCLDGLRKKPDSPEYREALAIIQAGTKRLQEQPDADYPGFQLAGKDAMREERYRNRQRIEASIREALRNGKRFYDTGMPVE